MQLHAIVTSLTNLLLSVLNINKCKLIHFEKYEKILSTQIHLLLFQSKFLITKCGCRKLTE